MEKAVFALQIFCTVIFLFTGSLKIFLSKEKLSKAGVNGFENMSQSTIYLLGVVEIIGALSITLPTLLGLFKFLTIASVICFAVLMIAASFFHFERKEYKQIYFPVFMLLTCFFILYCKINF